MTKLIIELEEKRDCEFALRAIHQRWNELKLSVAVEDFEEIDVPTGKLLTSKPRSRKGTTHRPWKDSELSFLSKNLDLSLNALAKKLDRTRAAVSVKKHWLKRENQNE